MPVPIDGDKHNSRDERVAERRGTSRESSRYERDDGRRKEQSGHRPDSVGPRPASRPSQSDVARDSRTYKEGAPDRHIRERDRHEDDKYRDHRREDSNRGSRVTGRPALPPPPPMRGRVPGSNLSKPQRTTTPPGFQEREHDDQRGTPGSVQRKAGTPGGSSNNPLVAELLKQGKLLASKTGDTGSGDDDAEAGEIIEEPVGSGGGRKRRHSPIVWDPAASKVPRPLDDAAEAAGPLSILERSQQEAAALKEMQLAAMAGDFDPDAPALMKRSPSLSSDQDEHDDHHGQNGNGSAAGDELHEGKRPKGVMSRWHVEEEEGGAQGAGSSPGQEPSQGVSGVGRSRGQQGAEEDAGEAMQGSDSGSAEDGDGTKAGQDVQQMRYDMRKECRDVHDFEKIEKISEGTYGVVYKAREKSTGRIVALKRVKMEHERNGFPITSVREINILLNFHHPNIVNVEEVVVSPRAPDQIYMVMEYADHDLKSLMEDKVKFSQPFSGGQVKNLMRQLLKGIDFLHENWVLHRDLKTSNILYNSKGELKLCDFGMARQYGDPLGTYTHNVVTLWYRAPELLFGQQKYSTALDMWSVGCIMGEILTGKPMMPGQGEFDQIDKMVQLLGTPTPNDWPGLQDLPNYKKISLKQVPSQLRTRFTATTAFSSGTTLTEAGFDLLKGLLAWDPDKRMTAKAALKHRWFEEVPLPVDAVLMPTFAKRKAG